MTSSTGFLEIRFTFLYLLVVRVPGLSLCGFESRVLSELGRRCAWGCLEVKISVVDFLLLSSLWIKQTTSSSYVFLFPIKSDRFHYIIFLLQISLTAVITGHHWCEAAAIVFIALVQRLGVITSEASDVLSYAKRLLSDSVFWAIYPPCVFSFLFFFSFTRSDHFMISCRCSNIIVQEHSEGHTKWTPCVWAEEESSALAGLWGCMGAMSDDSSSCLCMH